MLILVIILLIVWKTQRKRKPKFGGSNGKFGTTSGKYVYKNEPKFGPASGGFSPNNFVSVSGS